MEKRVVDLNQSWDVAFQDKSGNTRNMTLYSNREYEIKLENGTVHYVTISKVLDDGTIIPKLKIHPGFMKAITSANNTKFQLSKVREINLIHVKYTSAKRHAFDLPEYGESEFIEFRIPSSEGRKIRLTIHEGEMFSLVVKDNRPFAKNGRNVMYGHLVDYDAETNEIVFDRYIASGGKRSIRKKCRVKESDVINIFRYELIVEPFDEELASRSEQRRNNQTAKDEAPAVDKVVDEPTKETPNSEE